MSTFILIHGSWYGAWCWHKVVPLLEKAGHKALAIDLPGHGRDWTPAIDISLQSYVDCVCKVIDSQPDPVVLVGHSRGGIVLSQVAEVRPEKIEMSVYLCAFLILNGEPMLPTALGDVEALVSPNLTVNEEKGYHELNPEFFKEALYADCSDEDLTLAMSLLTPEPNAPVDTALETSEENFGRVRRVYIECLKDRAISPALQKKMYTAIPCQKVITMETSHSPFLSAPDKLVDHLISL